MRPYGQQPTTLLCSWDSLGKNTRVVPFPSPPLPHGGLYKPMTWYIGKVPRLDVGFHCSSDGKESACNAGDLGSIPRLGRSPGEGNDNPLQYSCLENPMGRGAWRATVHEVARVGHNLATKPPPPPRLHQNNQTSSKLLIDDMILLCNLRKLSINM